MRKVVKRIGIVLGSLIGLLLAALIGGCVYEQIAESRDAARFPAPGQLVDVGGRNLHLRCIGSGAPTVILEAGGATPSTVWWQVQGQIAEFTHVCSYDRAGLGWSDPNPNELSFEDGARDLKALLSAAQVAAPYILVGHSKGGLHVRTYARLYPDEVSGVLLLDAAEEEHVFANFDLLEMITAEAQGPGLLARFGVVRLIARFSPEAINIPDNLPAEGREELLSQIVRPDAFEAAYREFEDFRSTPIEMRGAGGFGRLGDLPLIVITHGLPFTGGQARTEPGWPEAQARLAALSSNSELLVAEQSQHAIFWDEPALVVDAVRRLLSQGRDSGAISGVGPGISVEEALTSNLTGPLLVNGHLHAQDDKVRLCELLAESFPPQCGGKTLVVEGLNLTTMDGLTSEGRVTWSDQLVQVLGTVDGEVLTVAATVR